jgi:hypothetical protein
VVRVNPERFNRLKSGTGKGLLDSLVAIVKSKDATPFLSEYYLYYRFHLLSFNTEKLSKLMITICKYVFYMGLISLFYAS